MSLLKRGAFGRFTPAKGKALDVVKRGKFVDGTLLSSKALNKLIFAIRELERRTRR